MPRTSAADSFARTAIAEVPLFPLHYIPKLRFPTFYVILCIDATCADPDVHLHAATFRERSVESDSHLACVRTPKVADIYGSPLLPR